jgi:hypothetical protein
VCCAAAGNQGALLCYEGLSSLEAFTGNLAGATALIATALSSRAATPRFLRAASNHYKRTGDMKRALGLAGRAARMAPQDHKNWLQVGGRRSIHPFIAVYTCRQSNLQLRKPGVTLVAGGVCRVMAGAGHDDLQVQEVWQHTSTHVPVLECAIVCSREA